VDNGIDVSIVLTRSQLAHVLREASPGQPGIASLVPGIDDLRSSSSLVVDSQSDGVSRSVLRALFVLAAFPLDGSSRSLTEVADDTGYNRSTTHRYVSTWLSVGVLEQDPKSRRYWRSGRPRVAQPS
jgi:response regulator of citrate/malate metabolism